MDRVRNKVVGRRTGIEREFASRADQRVLRWFGHRMARWVLMAEEVEVGYGVDRCDPWISNE